MSSSQYHKAEKPVSPQAALKRRQAGGSWWRNVIDNIIASEKADMQDLAALRRKTTDAELLRIIAEITERHAIRIAELTQLYHYRSNDDKANEPANDRQGWVTPWG